MSGPGLLQTGGKLGQAIRTADWAATPLGAVDTWPAALLHALDIGLSTRFPAAVFWGPDLRVLYNDDFASILGGKHPGALGAPARAVWTEAWDPLGKLLEAARSGEATWSEDLLVCTNTRGFVEEHYFTCSLSPIRSAGGSVEGVFGTFLETTGRVVGERRTRTIRDLVAHATEGRSAEDSCRIACASLRENPRDVPYACFYLAGKDGKARLVPNECSDALPELPAEVVLSGEDPLGIGSAWRTAQVRVVPAPPALPAGPWPERVRSFAIVPIHQSGIDAPRGVLVVGASPRLELDDTYLDFFSNVAGHIAQSITNATQHEEQRLRAEELAALNQAKTAFFSNVSHEFRTPLTLLLGPLEDYLTHPEQQSPQGAGEVVRLAYRNAMRLLKLVNTLLDFARIESGRTRAFYEPTDLSSYTADLAAGFGSASERVGLEYRVDCQPLDQVAYVDREMWEKIVVNLISNALKFTTQGAIEVSMAQSGAHAVLRVKDTGTGIPSNDLSRIFERFHTVRKQSGGPHEGTGIGLSLVHEFTKIHGGTVQVTSEVGQGTTFTVSIPLGRAHLPPDQVEGAAPAPARSSRALGTGVVPDPEPLPAAPSPTAGRVLLVEDNDEMRDYTARLLGRTWQVTSVATGIAALDEALRRPPDLILSDLLMPGFDGLQLLSAIRADPRTSTVPFIVLTARAGEEAIIRGLNAGVDDYLVKPFSARQLEARVTSSVALSQLRKQADLAMRESLERLSQARKMDSITKLAGGIAHDFNNILTTILGYVSLALARSLPADLRRDLTEVHLAGKRAATLTKQLLSYGQRQVLRPAAVQFNDLFRDVASHMRHVLGPTITLTLELDPDLGSAHVDRVHMEEALFQLILNAKESMPNGGTVQLKTERVQVTGSYVVDTGTLPAGSYVVWSVTDSGCGMDVKTRAMAFEPFFTTKQFGHGPGLGLSAVLGVVQQSGGQIKVDTHPGRGTTLQVYLPQVQRQQPTTVNRDVKVTSKTSPTVLLAEDEPPVRKFIAALLRGKGYRLLEARDGVDALAVMDQVDHIDLLVTDIMMPRMDGASLATELTRRQPGLKTLFISGYTGAHVIQEGLLTEEDHFLQKPFTPHELLGQVEAILRKT